MGGNEWKMGMNFVGKTLDALSALFHIALLSVYFSKQEQVDEEINLSLSIARPFY